MNIYSLNQMFMLFFINADSFKRKNRKVSLIIELVTEMTNFAYSLSATLITKTKNI